MRAPTYLEEYTSLLRTRKKYALIYTLVWGVIFAPLFAVAFGLVLAYEDRPVSLLSTIGIVMMVICPLIALMNRVMEYRRLTGMLELLGVLQQAAGENLLENDLGQSEP